MPEASHSRTSHREFRLTNDKAKQTMMGRVEEKMLKDTAASKGFNSVDDYVFHLLRQTPNWCGYLYDTFAVTYQCERQNRSSGSAKHFVLFSDKKVYSTRCEIYRNHLVSDCNATFDGNSLQFPDESHLNQKPYLSALERREVTAAMFGLTVREFEDHRRRRIAEKCKILSRDLEECVSRFGPKYKDCYRERRLIEKYCDK